MKQNYSELHMSTVYAEMQEEYRFYVVYTATKRNAHGFDKMYDFVGGIHLREFCSARYLFCEFWVRNVHKTPKSLHSSVLFAGFVRVCAEKKSRAYALTVVKISRFC